mmetsp:Transcript_18156/g.32521  ORF Transcript_18156/g.32521 Transcript_18156/m.32521 type:complete len:321 (+) Transcript_18156:208-1170(+)
MYLDSCICTSLSLMVENTNSMMSHHHVVLIAGRGNIRIASGPSRLGDVLDSILRRDIDIVSEREESVGRERNASESGQEFLFLLLGEPFWRLVEVLEPSLALRSSHLHLVDVGEPGVQPFDALGALLELQPADLRVLAEVPDTQLGPGELHAVDARLLPGAHAHHLAVLGEADRVGLGVFGTDGGQNAVDDGRVRHVLVLGDDVLEHLLGHHGVVPLLGEAKPVDLPVLVGGGLVGDIALEDEVFASLFGLEDFERLGVVARRNDSVADFALEDLGSGLVHPVGEGNEVTKGRLGVGVAGADVGGGERGHGFGVDVVDLC